MWDRRLETNGQTEHAEWKVESIRRDTLWLDGLFYDFIEVVSLVPLSTAPEEAW